jgi:photosystem II stability/assembly factor-like uncharacterized protein
MHPFSSKPLLLFLLVTGLLSGSFAQKKKDTKSTAVITKEESKNDPFNSGTFNGLKLRSIGPAVTSGRVVDLAINPQNHSEYYVAVAAGGVWKTTNHGITFEPVFEGESSYSIGCVTIDPSNTNVVWVGSGENNNQRAANYGDGVYKSEDGGKSWKNVGLKTSEHIGRIVVDPTNSDVVYVAAYGPLWSSGGERGIYKTTDGGKTWKAVLTVSEHTGFNEIHIDPRNPNVLYATAHQRQRKVFTYISGGPESAMYKSTDGGTTWNKLTQGLPSGDVGRIGMAISPVNPDILYAVIEATEQNGGVFRSVDRGASWSKMGGYSTSGNYYQELFCDPKNADKIYITDTYFMTSEDGGKTMKRLGEMHKHVDNHVIWLNPNDPNQLLVGCDGGLYESYDGGKLWNFKENLPVTQFYKVTTDNALPFYNVLGGTQDNFSLAGPSRTTSANGIVNENWIVTQGGDGFESQVDPQDPTIIYAQSQYGGLGRFDKKTGESVDIRPVELEGEPAYRWNWDAPLAISQHKSTRLYFAANKVFRTDDRGTTWKVISPDLSRQIDRNKLPVMGKVWSMDAISKNSSTDIYGNITTVSESKLDENLLYAGTDDGLIHVTTNGGQNWTKIDVNGIAGAPERTYVNQILASQHDKNIVYAVFNHHRYGDFKPYFYKSTDQGKTWTALQNNLPERGTVYTVAEDHVNAELLFVGTEFGLFFSNDGGQKWIQLKSGLPTIAVRDLDIQKRENDLVLATFGRGFYILDDYTPLRNLKKEDFSKEAFITAIKDAWQFLPAQPLGLRGKGFQGESYFATPNPTVGSVFTYYLKDDIKTLKEKRKEREKALNEKNQSVFYPSIDSLRLEEAQPAPYLLFTITDESGNTVRRLKAPAKKGLQRITWDFRYDAPDPVNFNEPDPMNFFSGPDLGAMAFAGNYKVSLSKFEDGLFTELVPAQPFKVVSLNAATLPDTDKKALEAFTQKAASLVRALGGAQSVHGELNNKMRFLKAAWQSTPKASAEMQGQLISIEKQLTALSTALYGDRTLARREFETLPSISERVGRIQGNLVSTSAAPTQTMLTSYQTAAKQFSTFLTDLRKTQNDISALETALQNAGAPHTPGRFPEWKENK